MHQKTVISVDYTHQCRLHTSLHSSPLKYASSSNAPLDVDHVEVFARENAAASFDFWQTAGLGGWTGATVQRLWMASPPLLATLKERRLRLGTFYRGRGRRNPHGFISMGLLAIVRDGEE